jgi:acyl-CoA thioester hydrolase
MTEREALLARHGVAGRWSVVREHEVRWSECDLYGHVNHAAYLVLFEDLRVDHWRGLTGRPLSPDAPGPVVSQLEVRYARPVGFLDRVLLTARTVALRRSSYTHEYALWKDGAAACTARCVCVVLRNDTGEKVAIPPGIRRAMIEEEGAAEEG